MRFDRVLVTGGAGFIGSHTVDALLQEGAAVWVLDDLSTGSLRNLRVWKMNRKLHFMRGSTVQANLVAALINKVDAVIHLAAIVSPFYSVKKPELVNAVNVTGTLNVLNSCVKKKTQKVVFASSSSVYGDQTQLPITEDNPIHPITPYGASKLSGEKYCGAYNRTYGLNTIALRYFNVYGERQSSNSYSGVIAIFSKQMRRGLQPKILGDGTQKRDFIHVSDVVQANLQALNANTGTGDAFNIGTGRAISINELSSLQAKLVNKIEITPIHAPARAGDIKDSYADITRAREVLGFEPRIELGEGLRALVNPAFGQSASHSLPKS